MRDCSQPQSLPEGRVHLALVDLSLVDPWIYKRTSQAEARLIYRAPLAQEIPGALFGDFIRYGSDEAQQSLNGLRREAEALSRVEAYMLRLTEPWENGRMKGDVPGKLAVEGSVASAWSAVKPHEDLA